MKTRGILLLVVLILEYLLRLVSSESSSNDDDDEVDVDDEREPNSSKTSLKVGELRNLKGKGFKSRKRAHICHI